MIRRLRVDNYKCMSNFEFEPPQIAVLMGANGSGKSTFCEVLELLRDFVTREKKTTELFPSSTLTKWETRPIQRFEIDLESSDGLFKYRLTIEHAPDGKKNRVTHESLSLDDQPLYSYDYDPQEGGRAQLYRDGGERGPEVLVDWSRSGVGFLEERHDNTQLCKFRKLLGRVLVFAIDPLRMRGESEEELAIPDRDLTEFSAWYRHTSGSTKLLRQYEDYLQDVLVGLDSIEVEKTGADSGSLEFEIEGSRTSVRYKLKDLSDGQRALLGLYAILAFLVDNDVTICLDEPANFLGLREIQPVIAEFRDQVLDRSRAQLLIASHHPEVLNYLGREHGVLFHRGAVEPVRTRLLAEHPPKSELELGELMATGWLEDE